MLIALEERARPSCTRALELFRNQVDLQSAGPSAVPQWDMKAALCDVALGAAGAPGLPVDGPGDLALARKELVEQHR
jgi:hypothetical protein